jgi:hypothetical protein
MLNNPNAYGREQMAVCENKIRQALAANSPSERVDRLTQSYERLDPSLHHAFLMVLVAHVSMKPVDNHLSDGMAPSPADPMRDWPRYCVEQGFSTLEEACPYEPPVSPQTCGSASSWMWSITRLAAFFMVIVVTAIVKLVADKAASRHASETSKAGEKA